LAKQDARNALGYRVPSHTNGLYTLPYPLLVVLEELRSSHFGVKTVLWLGGFWVGALNDCTFDNDLSRTTSRSNLAG
jgi:hypothetical protein